MKVCEVCGEEIPQAIGSLPVGTRFTQLGPPDHPDWEVAGVLVYRNECRARVRIDQGEQDWSPGTMVVPTGELDE